MGKPNPYCDTAFSRFEWQTNTARKEVKELADLLENTEQNIDPKIVRDELEQKIKNVWGLYVKTVIPTENRNLTKDEKERIKEIKNYMPTVGKFLTCYQQNNQKDNLWYEVYNLAISIVNRLESQKEKGYAAQIKSNSNPTNYP